MHRTYNGPFLSCIIVFAGFLNCPALCLKFFNHGFFFYFSSDSCLVTIDECRLAEDFLLFHFPILQELVDCAGEHPPIPVILPAAALSGIPLGIKHILAGDHPCQRNSCVQRILPIRSQLLSQLLFISPGRRLEQGGIGIQPLEISGRRQRTLELGQKSRSYPPGKEVFMRISLIQRFSQVQAVQIKGIHTALLISCDLGISTAYHDHIVPPGGSIDFHIRIHAIGQCHMMLFVHKRMLSPRYTERMILRNFHVHFRIPLKICQIPGNPMPLQASAVRRALLVPKKTDWVRGTVEDPHVVQKITVFHIFHSFVIAASTIHGRILPDKGKIAIFLIFS